jgi:hypothetical protein
MQSNKYGTGTTTGTVPKSISVKNGKLIRKQNNSRTFMDSIGIGNHTSQFFMHNPIEYHKKEGTVT